ncbi:MAG: hypothetical protein ACXADH_11075 [Candidatus Kariarchaeaceae archaeon]|jgi:hypothetical protein
MKLETLKEAKLHQGKVMRSMLAHAQEINETRLKLIRFLREVDPKLLDEAAKHANLWNFKKKLFEYSGDITTAKLVKIFTALNELT